MCDNAMKIKDIRIAQLEAALFQALKKQEVPVKDSSKPKTQVHSQRISVESNKENITNYINNQQSNVRLEDFLRKKSPSNPVNTKSSVKPVRPESSKGSSSSRILTPANIEFNNKLITSTLSQRPATSAGYPKGEIESSKTRFKTQSIFGENLSEMFRKKKNASSVHAVEKKAIGNLTKQLTINTPKFDYPLTMLKPESPNNFERVHSARSVEKRAEIEDILLKLLEKHKETSIVENNFLNKLNFIEKAIKRWPLFDLASSRCTKKNSRVCGSQQKKTGRTT